MGGICCKDGGPADSPKSEKESAPAATQQGANPILAGVTTTTSEEAKAVHGTDQRQIAGAGSKGEVQSLSPANLPLGSPPAPAEASSSAIIDPAQIAVDEKAVQVAKTVPPQTATVPNPVNTVPASLPAALSNPKPGEPAIAPSTISDVVQVAPAAPSPAPISQPQPSPPAPPPIAPAVPPVPAAAPSPSRGTAAGAAPEQTPNAAVPRPPQLSAAMLDAIPSESTTPFSSEAQHTQQTLTSDTRASYAVPSEEGARIKVETTRKTAPAGAPFGEASSSVSYSHSATSSQQQGSSAAAGSAGPMLSPMLGSSAAPGTSTAGEPQAAGADAANTAGPDEPNTEGSSTQQSDGNATTASAIKPGNTGFMFGAPRMKEHKEKRRKEGKRAKSHSSSSTQSNPAPPTGSDTVTNSKASGAASGVGSDAAGNGRGAGTMTTAAGSSMAAPAAPGSSAFAPSLSSTDAPSSSTTAFRPLAGQGSSSLGATDSTLRSDYKTIGRGRRVVAPAAAKAAAAKDSNDGSSGLSGSRGGRDSSAGVSAAGAGSGLAADGDGGSALPEMVPEEEAEGEATDHSASSGRSSSEHLSIMSPPEGSDVENVLQLICNIFQLPVALVAAYRSANIFIRSTALKLTDDDQWRYSLAQWSMLNAYELRDVLMVPDARQDERFRDYFCVQHKPQIRFFMASPLRSSTGELLGTLCMADFTERMLEPTNLLVVNNLQTLVIKQLERDMLLAQERIENEVATAKLQQEMMRALDHFEKCIMFVDTSKPGWEVLYTNMAWEHVTGVPRVHVAGRPLHDFFMALGGAALDWSSTAAEVASRAEFTVHRVAVRQKPDKLVSLHLRLASAEASGELEGLLPKGLPSWVKSRGNEDHNYFVFVEEVVPQVGGGSTVYEALAKHVEKVPGLELSHLLGKGGFGSVYYGTWNGLPVAVKMIDNKLTKTNTEGVSLEALMGQELSHPNIVKTIKYVMRSARNGSSVSGSNSRGIGSNPRGVGPHSRHSGLAVVTSQHGSRNLVASPAGGHGSGGAGAVGHGPNGGGIGGNGMIQTSNAHGMTPYMTSAQPGLSGMTSAQMAAALDLTSASGMHHLQRQATTTTTSDATTVAGGGSSYSTMMQGDPSQGAAGAAAAGGGMPPRVGNLIGSTPPTPHHGGGTGADTSTTTTNASGITAVGPASVHASSASTAAGPPSIASGGGAGPANMSTSQELTRAASAANLTAAAGAATPAAAGARTAGHGAGGPAPAAFHPLGAGRGSVPGRGGLMGTSFRGSAATTPAAPGPALDGGGRVAPVALPPTLPQLAAPARAADAIIAPYPPGAPPPNLPPNLTPEQQAAMTSRFSLAFSTITSGGDVLVPGKGRSPSSSSGGGMTQPMAMGSAGSGEDMGEVWIIMEFCDRGSLQDALDRGALKLRKVGGEVGETHLPMMVATACEVASALQYLHGKGIVHGDLTAWNVMLCTGQQDRSGRNFTAKVADFGLSRTLDVRSKIKTRTYGTISHMPPECLISGIISKATDVFAFGVLLWQMYTGLRPWAGMNHGQIIYNVGMKNVQLLFPPGTPPAIADLSSSCTRTDPIQRPSFNEIMDKLDKIRASLGL